ncbi:MAG: hypothetical protein HYR55_05585 [Acidobacteria bacterium]|nr:hypothetical protein [Acidobacteriota bacterium]MBI3657784.1 hypothetical protein [Acidobacteriota bacterium]
MIILRVFFSILRLLFFIALFAFIWRVVSVWLKKIAASGIPADREPHIRSSTQANGSPMITGKTVRDPVCGTYVATELAVPLTRPTATVFFCSEDCKRKYQSVKS